MKTGSWITKFRIPVLAAVVLATIFLGLQLPRAQVDSDLKNHMPETMASRVSTERIEEIFGGSEMILLLLETEDILEPATLERVGKITRKLNMLDGIDQTLSLFEMKDIRSEYGMMMVEPAVPRIPRTERERERLRETLRQNDMVHKIVVSDDFTMTAIIATLEKDAVEENILGGIDSVLEEFQGDEKVYLGGMPVIRQSINEDITRDFSILMPLALALMLMVLFLTLKQVRSVLLPFSVVVFSIVFAMGLLPVIGWKIAVITILLPIMLIAIANNYGIHMMARYQEVNTGTGTLTKEDLAGVLFQKLSRPVLVTGLTTIAGVLGLLSHIMIPAKELGIIAAIGIGYSLLLSLIYIPSVLSFLPKAKPVKIPGAEGETGGNSLLFRLGSVVAGQPEKILLATAVLFVIAIAGIFRVEVDSNQENFFPEDHPVRAGATRINDHFGGSQNLSILFTGDIKDPAVLKRMDRYERTLEGIPGVGSTISIAGIVRRMSRALNDKGDPGYDTIPASRNGVAQYFELYTMSGDPEDFEKLVDFDYSHAQLIVRINNGNTSTVKNIVAEISSMVADDQAVETIGGTSLAIAELADIVVKGQFLSLFAALAAIAVLMMILFRSLAAAIISGLPLVLAITVLFGLMGFFGIPLDIVSALLSSIVIGVGVDYTIHFLWRYREERGRGLGYGDAAVRTLATTGRGITFNAVSVIIGFSALFISSFIPIKLFAFLVVVSISACLFGALVLVPAACIVWKPGFLEPSNCQKFYEKR